MNVYDFDGTIYKGDSAVDLYWFALKREPQVLRCLPKQLLGFFLYAQGKISKTDMKSCYFSFLSVLCGESLIREFWRKNRKKIYLWYQEQQAADDVVISASPDFLLEPVCRELGIRNLIASKADIKTGVFQSENCYGEEKVRRFRGIFENDPIDSFYSDSLSDAPMARTAQRAFLVKKGKAIHWPAEKRNKRVLL